MKERKTNGVMFSIPAENMIDAMTGEIHEAVDKVGPTVVPSIEAAWKEVTPIIDVDVLKSNIVVVEKPPSIRKPGAPYRKRPSYPVTRRPKVARISKLEKNPVVYRQTVPQTVSSYALVDDQLAVCGYDLRTMVFSGKFFGVVRDTKGRQLELIQYTRKTTTTEEIQYGDYHKSRTTRNEESISIPLQIPKGIITEDMTEEEVAEAIRKNIGLFADIIYKAFMMANTF